MKCEYATLRNWVIMNKLIWFTNHIPTMRLTFTDYIPTTYRPHTDHVPTTYRLRTDHIPTTNRPHTDHVPEHIPTDQLVHYYRGTVSFSVRLVWLFLSQWSWLEMLNRSDVRVRLASRAKLTGLIGLWTPKFKKYILPTFYREMYKRCTENLVVQ